MGYYDIHGYGGLHYSNLVPGGVAESSTTYGDPTWNALVKPVIASQEYVNDYYSGDNNCGFNAYGVSGDDVATPTHTNNCLADFMGTSQDAAGNSDGSTALYYWRSGAKFTAKNAVAAGLLGKDGMVGMDEYFRYAGYGTGNIDNDTNFYTQLIKGKGTNQNLGFTFEDYIAEINAGRVVMIQVTDHSMFGYGYTDDGKIIFDDTWGDHDQTMAWGGSYDGMNQWGVTVFTPSGGKVPLPSTFLLMVSGLAGLVGWKVRFRQK